MHSEDERTGAGVLQKACDVINAMTPEQKAAVELYVKSERHEEYDSAYAKGYSDGERNIDIE